MFKGQILPRTTKMVAAYEKMLRDKNVPFAIRHGTYTTKIIHPNGEVKFTTTNYRKQVFIAYNKVKRDILNSDRAKEIMKVKHETLNYGNGLAPHDFYVPQVLNIDINQAYATCLYVHRLITKETYDYIQGLRKQERLVAIGMLAKGYTEFSYENGECIKVTPFREKTAEIFFWIIQEINYIMRDMKFFLGKDFIMYWVDGIFFDYGTSKNRIREAEDLLLEQGYHFKYEDCKEFDYKRINQKIVVSMIKNGEHKRYEYRNQNGKDILTRLYEKSKSAANQIHAGGIKGILEEQSIILPYD